MIGFMKPDSEACPLRAWFSLTTSFSVAVMIHGSVGSGALISRVNDWT
jgi:hypothetical protein